MRACNHGKRQAGTLFKGLLIEMVASSAFHLKSSEIEHSIAGWHGISSNRRIRDLIDIDAARDDKKW
jgi:hypothetical protein